MVASAGLSVAGDEYCRDMLTTAVEIPLTATMELQPSTI